MAIQPVSEISAIPARREAAVNSSLLPERRPPSSPPRLRLEVLDAVRGLAALVVVVFHIRFLLVPITEQLSRPFHLLAAIANHGHDAVVVFIVLSGFVLSLPVARAAVVQLQGGLKEYVRRRARRILPPYFAALIICLLLGCLWVLISQATGQRSVRADDNPFLVPHTTMGAVMSHLVMIHNVRRTWAIAVDPPMWSVATEWQIYFLFPLVLLPLWRYFGLAAAVVGGFAVGLIPLLVLSKDTNFDAWCPWMLGDFALGMAAAAIAFAPSHKVLSKGISVWGYAFLGVVAVLAMFQVGLPRVWHAMADWDKDVLVGGAVGLLLVYLSRCQTGCTKQPLVFRLLDTRAAILLGSFSYSLYLVHFPVLFALNVLIGTYVHSLKLHVIVMYIVGPILSLIFGYAFHLAFEKPFMRTKPRSAQPR
jgi:peptidoglycan/LPS O-acetylase OafA/YrhL